MTTWLWVLLLSSPGGFCTSIFTTLFHREGPIRRIEKIIEKGFEPDATVSDYMQAYLALNKLEEEVQRLREKKKLEKLDEIYEWTQALEGEGFIQNRLKKLREP